MRYQHLILTLALSLSSTLPLCAQQPSFSGGGLKPFSAVLQEKGITTRDEVVRALTDPDPMIRSVAACRLAELKDPQAIELVTEANSSERDPMVKIDFESALWSLGVSSAASQLEATCQDKSVDEKVLHSAVVQLSLRRKGGVCLPNLITSYAKADNGPDRAYLLSLMQNVYRDAPPNAADTLTPLAAQVFSSGGTTERLQTMELLVALGTPSARQTLASALNNETDALIKEQLQQALNRLDKNVCESNPTLARNDVACRKPAL